MKRLGLIALTTCLFMNTAQSQEPWVVGLMAPMTGPLVSIGTPALSTLQWWEQAVNAKGGIHGRQVKLSVCNDEASPEKATICARRFIDEGAVVILNSSVTGPIRAAMSLLQNGPVIIFPSPNVMPAPTTYGFQTTPTDADMVKIIANYLKANNKNQLGMIASTDASGEVSVASASAIFPKEGIKYELARIDLKANDASIQLSRVAGAGVPLVYSAYSGGGAVAVVKSYKNLGLTQPLMVSFANISDVFTNLIKNDMPPRLLAVGMKYAAPEMLEVETQKKHILSFMETYQKWKGERADQPNVNTLILADIAEAILTNVADPKNAASVKQYLETTPIESIQTIRFSKDSHIGLAPDDLAVIEYKSDRWQKAGPL